MIVLIDNYDSFTFNLFHYLGGLGADVVVLSQRQDRHRRVIGDRSGRHRALARSLHAERSRHLPRPHRQGGADHPDAGRVPRPSGDRAGVRRRGGARAGAGARQALRNQASGRRRLSRHQCAVQGDPLPFAGGRAREPAGRPHGDRGDRRPAGHGARPSRAAGARRAVPSRKHRLRARPSHPAQLSRHRRGVECDERPAPGRRRRAACCEGRT